MAQLFYVSKRDSKQDGIAALIIVLLTVIIFIVISLVVIFGTIISRERIISKKGKTNFPTIVVAHVLTALAGVSYLLGNKIGIIFAFYGQYLNCDDNCSEGLIEMGNTLIIFTILLLTLTPLFVNKINVLTIHVLEDTDSIKENKDRLWSPWKIIAQSLALMLDLDAWFTAISDIPEKEAPLHCPVYEMSLEWSMFVVSLIIWGILLVVIGLPGIIKAYRTKENGHKAVILCVILALIWVVSGGYVLADNTQPLACTFGCYTDLPYLYINDTSIDCHYEAFHSTRAIILFIVLIFLTSMTITLIVHWCQKHSKTIFIFRKECNDNKTQDQTPDNQEMTVVENEADNKEDVSFEQQTDIMT